MNVRVEQALNDQIEKGVLSTQYYLTMDSWAERDELNESIKFTYLHSNHDPYHIIKLVKERVNVITPPVKSSPIDFDILESVFTLPFEQETIATESINNFVDICLQEKEYSTTYFLRWYVSDQLKEVSVSQTILDNSAMLSKKSNKVSCL